MASAAQAVVSNAKEAVAKVKPSVEIPKLDGRIDDAPKTPKTPADEGIEFFESVRADDAPINVYELRLDPDGGPSKDLSVSFHPF
jgi:glycogen debranching enzyme